MKLLNFSSLDPTKTVQGKAGLKQTSKLDAEVWAQFANKPDELAKTAEAIRNEIKRLAAEGATVDEDPGTTQAPEGRLLTRTHRVRERRPELVVAVKKREMKLRGYLACAACDMRSRSMYAGQADDIVDCHHTKPVHTLGENGITHIDDLVLLCPNCHRLVHSVSPWLEVDELKRRLTKQASSTQ